MIEASLCLHTHSIERDRRVGVPRPSGLNHGLDREEIEEIMVQMTIYGGIPRAVEGIRAAKQTV